MKKLLIGLLILGGVAFANSSTVEDNFNSHIKQLDKISAELTDAFSFHGKQVDCNANVLYWEDSGITYNKNTDKPFYCRNVLLITPEITLIHGVIIFDDKNLNNEIGGVGRITSIKLLQDLNLALVKEKASYAFKLADIEEK